MKCKKLAVVLLLALVGMTAELAETQARGRRGRSQCCPPVECESSGTKDIHYSGSRDPISIHYPRKLLTGWENVPGGGRFFIWGRKNATVILTNATATWDVTSTSPGIPVVMKELGTEYYGYRFDISATGKMVTVTVEGTENGSGVQPASVTFQVIN